jgi:ABC-type amino acid transport substrate-binding protein
MRFVTEQEWKSMSGDVAIALDRLGTENEPRAAAAKKNLDRYIAINGAICFDVNGFIGTKNRPLEKSYIEKVCHVLERGIEKIDLQLRLYDGTELPDALSQLVKPSERNHRYLVRLEASDAVRDGRGQRSAKGKQAPQRDALSHMRMTGVVTVGCVQWPPFVDYDQVLGKASGLYLEVIEHFANDMKLRVKYKRVSLRECLDEIESGALDMAPGIFESKYRLTRGDFCGFMHMVRMLGVGRRGAKLDKRDVPLKIAVTQDGVSDEIAKYLGVPTKDMSYVSSHSFSTLIGFVRDRVADIAICDPVAYFKYARGKRGVNNSLAIVWDAAFVCPCGFLVGKGQDQLKAMINTAVERVLTSEAFRKREQNLLKDYSPFIQATFRRDLSFDGDQY